jgi:hypothetical protein
MDDRKRDIWGFAKRIVTHPMSMEIAPCYREYCADLKGLDK